MSIFINYNSRWWRPCRTERATARHDFINYDGARGEVYNFLRNVRKRNCPQRFHLAALLGYRSVKDMWVHWSKRDEDTCKALLGPHGETVYKILRARWKKSS